jgi:hypothetical protein
MKGDIEKRKAEGRTKRVHEPNASSSSCKLKRVNKWRHSEEEEEDSSDQDDPPMTHEEIQAQTSEQVNITTSTVLPDL